MNAFSKIYIAELKDWKTYLEQFFLKKEEIV